MSEKQTNTPPQETPPEGKPTQPPRRYLRWSLASRIEHWVFITSFSLLGLTGLAQKYATSQISIALIAALGGIESTRIIHRIAATIMMFVTVYHLGAIGYRIFVLRTPLSMLPGVQDVQAALQALKYNLGFSKSPPQQGHFTFEEKLEYWAVVWGTVIMAITGFMMWNPIATARYLPGEYIPAAKAAHSGEALLAVLAIVIWHMYHVIIKHFNRSMFTGYLTEEEMLHEHPLELAEIKAGLAPPPPPDGKTRQKRLRTFLPSYSVIAAVMLAGIYFFVTFEETAIATLPPAERVEVFVPLTPTPLPTPIPTRTPPPGGLASWESGVGELFQQRCGICHNPTGKIGGLDLTSYEAALQNGNSGPGVVPGDPASSQVITKQLAGNHAEQLSAEEISQLSDWIAAGAP